MEYTQMYNASDGRCDVHTENRNRKRNETQNDGHSQEWYRSPFLKGCFVGLCIGTGITAIVLLTINWSINDKERSCKSQGLQSNISAFSNNTIMDYSTEETKVPTTSTKLPTTTVATPMDHYCKVKGGCTSPPKTPEGTACLYESKDGRTSAAYSALKRTTSVTFDHCPVSVCMSGDHWSNFNVSQSTEECYSVNYYSAAVYKGKNTCTATGRVCQRWDQDFPHERNPKHIPKNEADLRSNYCRDPGPPYDHKPWCYTTDSKVRWEYCFVSMC